MLISAQVKFDRSLSTVADIDIPADVSVSVVRLRRAMRHLETKNSLTGSESGSVEEFDSTKEYNTTPEGSAVESDEENEVHIQLKRRVRVRFYSSYNLAHLHLQPGQRSASGTSVQARPVSRLAASGTPSMHVKMVGMDTQALVRLSFKLPLFNLNAL
jgi:hypothetical protein